ncbi:McrC family protein [Streptomyces hydrogenans]|uniref:McrC family protein n=1 Tax=Streptomyces hydrogenans TaxID=1873719 RepID=UPI0035DECBC1
MGSDGPVPFELTEYATRVFDGVRLTDSDRRLLDEGSLDARLRLRQLRGGRLEVTAAQYVGTVRLEAAEFRVVPKYLGGELDVLRMLDHAGGGVPAPLPAVQTLTGGRPHLRDLVCLMVVEHGERLLRHGVMRDYVTVEDDLRVVRGRLLPDRQLLRHHGRPDVLACRFEEHEADVVENRLCAAALALTARTARDDGVRARARRAAGLFAGHAPTPVGDVRAALASLAYHRHNEHYRSAHVWAGLLLTGGGVDGLFAAGPLVSHAFMVDMNALFESFVTRLLKDGAAGSGTRVESQTSHASVLFDERRRRGYGTARPDLLLSGRGGRLPVDVKYKLYGERKLAPQDLYQASFYAQALGLRADGGPPECVLVHPAPAGTEGARVAVRTLEEAVTARIRAVPLDLRAALAELGGPDPRAVPARLFREVTG